MIVPSAPELATREPNHWPLLLSYAWPFFAIVVPEEHIYKDDQITTIITIFVKRDDLAVPGPLGRALVHRAAPVHAGLARVSLWRSDQQPENILSE